jgi:hypothetical protein
VIPAEHVLGFVGFQKAVSGNVAEGSLSDCALEALQELAGEAVGLVEAEAGGEGGLGLKRVTLNLVEEPIHDAEVVRKVGVEGRAEAIEEAHGAERGLRWCARTGHPQRGLEGPEEDVKNGADGPRPVMEERPTALVGLAVWFLPKRLLDPLAELHTQFQDPGLDASRPCLSKVWTLLSVHSSRTTTLWFIACPN